MSKDVKLGVVAGDNRTVVQYRWSVLILDRAFNEAMKILTPEQYAYAAEQVKALATEPDPTHSNLCSVDAIEDFHELREKHGVLGKINLRIFFFLDRTRNAIVILGTIKKENNGPTPDGTRITMRRRKRLFLESGVEIPALPVRSKEEPQ
jgi:hypothetical protein